MPELKVVGKDTTLNGGSRELEIHWQSPDGSHIIDTYAGDYTLENDDSGNTTVTVIRKLRGGKVETTTTTYNYGEDRKIVEKKTN